MIYECSYNNIKGRHCYLALMNNFCLFYKYHTDVYVTVVGSTGSVTRTVIACGSGSPFWEALWRRQTGKGSREKRKWTRVSAEEGSGDDQEWGGAGPRGSGRLGPERVSLEQRASWWLLLSGAYLPLG